MKKRKLDLINILIVDDNVYNLMILNHYLESMKTYNFKIIEVFK